MAQNLSFKVSQKGAISVYGLGRFPTTLYPEQWSSLFACAELAQFVAGQATACEEQQAKYRACEALAESKGLKEKAKDDFIAKLLDDGKPKTTTVLRKNVDQKLYDMFAAKAAKAV